MQFCSSYNCLFGPYHSTGNSFPGSKKDSSYSTVARAQIIHYVACVFGHYGILPEVHLRICRSCLSTHGLLKLKVFTWNHIAITTFLQFKNILTTPPILHIPDFTIPFVVETDASNSAIGAVLSQARHPIAFFSKKLCPTKQSSSILLKRC